jgi:hypothetical protein
MPTLPPRIPATLTFGPGAPCPARHTATVKDRSALFSRELSRLAASPPGESRCPGPAGFREGGALTSGTTSWAQELRPEGYATASRAARFSSGPFGLFLLLLRATLLAVLLDLRFREIFVLRANHSENGRRTVRAPRNGTELNRPFAPLAPADRRVELACSAKLQPGRCTTTESIENGVARARDGVLLDQRRQSVDELLNEILNIGPSGHLLFPPFVAGQTSREDSTMQTQKLARGSCHVKRDQWVDF